MDEKNVNKQFVSLVISLSAAAWQQLGKVQSVITGKVERDLDEAKVSIDILEMLKEKTKNNLTEEEEKLLLTTLTDLQLNYIEELKKEEPPETKH
ncbi:MAG: DUF1844 domain-containing protein [Elusimicrobiota bacterium]